jgi:nitrite reductase/ring-hydroxylating ferredoxin subunit
VEIDGKEILIANIDGKFYAINDRCGHMNALLSMGNLAENVVTCLFMEQDLILPQARR